jgi:hypothetical protein
LASALRKVVGHGLFPDPHLDEIVVGIPDPEALVAAQGMPVRKSCAGRLGLLAQGFEILLVAI